MFKFWKKKPVETPAPQVSEVDTAVVVADAPASVDETASLVFEAQSVVEATPELSVEVVSVEAEASVVEPSFVDVEPVAVEPLAVEPIVEAEFAPPPIAVEEPAAVKRSWRERLSGSAFSRGLGSLFARNPKLDDDLLDELETLLITADVGIAAATEIVDELRSRVAKRDFSDADALLAALRAKLMGLLKPVEQPLRIEGGKPFVILVVGVNGAGKTTTIGKLARHQQAAGRSVVLAAGDTFRAAAVEQLTTWGQRNNVPVIAQGSGADSASVIYDALQTAGSRGADLLIADTAGRLHTQTGLMDELTKIRRVLSRFDGNAPHEVLLVIDGTTGQNAVNQTRQFRQAIGVTGLVVTKLDGTAKGGVVFALAREFGLPIRYVGLGEKIEDLRVFDAAAFVDGLLPATLARPG